MRKLTLKEVILIAGGNNCSIVDVDALTVLMFAMGFATIIGGVSGFAAGATAAFVNGRSVVAIGIAGGIFGIAGGALIGTIFDLAFLSARQFDPHFIQMLQCSNNAE